MAYPYVIVNTDLNILLFLYEYDVGGVCFGLGIGGPLGEWAVNIVCWSGYGRKKIGAVYLPSLS